MIKEIAALKEEQPPLDKRLKELQAELKTRKKRPNLKSLLKYDQEVLVKKVLETSFLLNAIPRASSFIPTLSLANLFPQKPFPQMNRLMIFSRRLKDQGIPWCSFWSGNLES